MTQDLRAALEELSDAEGRALAAAAPEPAVEAGRVDALIRRRRAVRVTGIATGAAAAVLVGVLAAQGLSAPAPMLPAGPTGSSTSPTPTTVPPPSPAPADAPSGQVTGSTPTAPAVTWPVAVGEDEVVSSDGGSWWVVVVTSGPPDTPQDDPEQAELTSLGYAPTSTPLDCVVDTAGEAAFPVEPTSETWAVWGLLLYFRTADDADAFVDAWGSPVERVVEGSLACGWG